MLNSLTVSLSEGYQREKRKRQFTCVIAKAYDYNDVYKQNRPHKYTHIKYLYTLTQFTFAVLAIACQVHKQLLRFH